MGRRAEEENLKVTKEVILRRLKKSRKVKVKDTRNENRGVGVIERKQEGFVTRESAIVNFPSKSPWGKSFSRTIDLKYLKLV